MDRNIDVRTPESISFRYELAGLGSRFLAVFVDTAIQIGVLILIAWGLVSAAAYAPSTVSRGGSAEARFAESIAVGLLIAIVFMVLYGYFILFEAFWDGQTPGKKLLGIRVVRDGGYPLDFGGAVLRNLVRIGEQIFGLYAMAAICALISPENKRLGDFAAGTIVVREAPLAAPRSIRETLAAAAVPRSSAYLSDEERALISGYLTRRERMDAAHRREFAAALAQRVRGRAPSELQRLSDDELLERV